MEKDISPPRLRRASPRGVEFDFISGHPVLDFHNTASWPRGRKSNERMRHPLDLLRWAAGAAVITEREAKSLGSFARRNYSRASATLDDAYRLREVIHHLLTSVANEKTPAASMIDALNRRRVKAIRAFEMKWHDDRLEWAPRADPPMTAILDRLVWGAEGLLISDDIKRVRLCRNQRCGWLFIDRTKNGTRRWCSMEECGGRAKSKRYYERHA